MKKLLVVLLKTLLLLALLAIIGGLTFGFVIWMRWPWWVGLCFVLVYFVLYCTWVLIRKILLRRKEKSFVNEVIAQDEAYRRSLGDGGGQAELDLQAAWKEAIDTLHRSKLGKNGNPLYVLPWYMVIGESGSGKTTAIKSAGLSAPFAEARKTSGLGSTRNCDWWFFEQAVILDTAGRYAIPLEEGRDRKEWQKFLALLSRYRKHEAINGLVVTIAADKLLRAPEEEIIEDGRNIRQRIDELMRVVGIKFPVYVLVTKCDLVRGMTDFCNKLPERRLSQVMGYLNRGLTQDVGLVSDNLFSSVIGKLRSLRLLLFGSGVSPGPELLLFPNEFGNVEKNLRHFVETAFKANPYQETPLLRGLYFSSGKQEGTPYSHFLKELGLLKQQDVLPGTSRGLFLHDLFSTVMAADRNLYAPTRKALAWSRMTRNIGLVAWAALFLSLCGLLSFSFMKNLTTLRTVADAFEQPVALQGEILTDTAIMERYQEAVSHIEKTNDNWWFPRFWLDESLEVEQRIKEKYCARFHDEFAADFDTQLQVGVGGVSSGSPDLEIGRYVVHLTHRINLIQARLKGRGYGSLAKMDKPSFQHFLSAADSKLVSQLSERISGQYLYYLAWQAQDTELQNELRSLQKQLNYILSLPDSSLNWIAAWLNENSGMDYLTLDFFWGAVLEDNDLATVPPAFSSEGKKAVETLVGQIEEALADELVIAANKARFWKWYNRAYKQIWFDFAKAFLQAEYYLKDREAWQQAASIMAAEKGPYFAFMAHMHKELDVLDDRADENWLLLLQSVEKIRVQAQSEKAIKEKKSMLAKVAKTGQKAVSKIEKKMDKAGLNVENPLESTLTGGVYFNDYRTALSDLVLATSSRKVSFEMTSEIFKQDPATSEEPMYVAQRNLIKMKNELSRPGAGKETLVIWKLVAGPLSFLRDFAYLEAACNLNAIWEEKVLVEIQDMYDKTELNQELFEQNGLALQFIKGPASPFLGRSLEKGFYPRNALGRMVPFRKEFLTFLNDGIRLARYKPEFTISDEVPLSMKKESDVPPEPELKSNYRVMIEASPTSVNQEAKMVPHAVSLELTCGADVERLVNLQYPVRRKFDWKPEQCQGLSLKIEIGSLVLEKKYEDKYSFARFVNDYRQGQVTYNSLDFPGKEKQLKRLNVRTVTVKFKITEGALPLVKVMQQLEAHNKALGITDERKGGDEQNMAEIMMSLEEKRKSEELENEALKKAWKAKQLARAAEIKRKWEEQLPDVPLDITICWD